MRQLALCTMIAASFISAAASTPIAERVQNDLEFKFDDWTQRSTSFYKVVHEGVVINTGSEYSIADGIMALARLNVVPRPMLSKALSDLLARETDLVSSGNSPASEDFSNYYGDVIQAVTVLRDKTAMTTFRCINTGGMAISALASFGDDALSSVLQSLPKADEEDTTQSDPIGR